MPLKTKAKEEVTKIRARRGVYINKDLPAGHILTEEDLILVRPSTDYSCNNEKMFIGKKLDRALLKYTPLGFSETIIQGKSNWKEAGEYWENEMKEKKMLN